MNGEELRKVDHLIDTWLLRGDTEILRRLLARRRTLLGLDED